MSSMHVGNLSYAGTLSRPGQSGSESFPRHSGERPGESAGRQTHFRAISSISHGSLSAAYQALRAHELRQAAPPPAPVETAPAAPAILSAGGIQAAMLAYADTGEQDNS